MAAPFLLDVTRFRESNGVLSVFEQGAVPFAVKRAFLVEARQGQVRGAHAHLQCWQALFVVTGSVEVTTVGNASSEDFLLKEGGDSVLVLPPLVWATQKYIDDFSRLLVVCSEAFDEHDYIRVLEDFEKLTGNSPA